MEKNETIKTLEEYKENIQKFANKFKLTFEEEGECGFGRECVGLSIENKYVDYNPTDLVNYDNIEGFYDDRFFDITPENAYHKHNCLAVLGRGENAIKELSEWVDKLNELNVVVGKYYNGATGVQAMVSGTYGYAVRIPK